MNIKTKRIICLLIGIASVLTIVGTVSYAYFTALGETKKQEATISTGTARATFRDGDTGITGELSFGESLTKKFTIENTGTVEANVKMYWKDLVNTYTEGSLTYTLSQSETEDGSYKEVVSKTNIPKSERSTTEILANNLTIPVGKTYYYNLVINLNYLKDVNQDADINAKFISSFDLKDINYKDLSPSEKTLVALGQTSQGIRTNFYNSARTDEGIYEIEDDYGTSYYYRGAVEDNYVKYGVNKDGLEMWWRIIRINGDGSIRLLYDGSQGWPNGTSNSDRVTHTSVLFNPNKDDTKYVGWMYGPTGSSVSTSKDKAQSNIENSNIKKEVDTWYKENIVDTGYSNSISDEIFCNDRSIHTGLGYGKNTTFYNVKERTTVNFNPNLVCSQQNDAFTVEDIEKGNAKLTYPVGLITTDEIVIAGKGRDGDASPGYWYRGENYFWTMSPYAFTNGTAHILYIRGSSIGDGVAAGGGVGIAPVINLSPEFARNMVGTGIINDPYRTKNT